MNMTGEATVLLPPPCLLSALVKYKQTVFDLIRIEQTSANKAVLGYWPASINLWHTTDELRRPNDKNVNDYN